MFDGHPNPFIQLNLSKDELAEAYAFFHGVDSEGQLLVIEALDRKYSVLDLINIG